MKLNKLLLILLAITLTGAPVFAQQRQQQSSQRTQPREVDPDLRRNEMREVERMAKRNPNALALLALMTKDKTKSAEYWKQAAAKKQPEALYRVFVDANKNLKKMTVDLREPTDPEPPKTLGTDLPEFENLKAAAEKKYAPAMFLLAEIYLVQGQSTDQVLPLLYEALEVALTQYGVDVDNLYLQEFCTFYKQVERMEKSLAEFKGEVPKEQLWAKLMVETFPNAKKLLESQTAAAYWINAGLESPKNPISTKSGQRSIDKGNIWGLAFQCGDQGGNGSLDPKAAKKRKAAFDKHPLARGYIAIHGRSYTHTGAQDAKKEEKSNKKFAFESAAPAAIRQSVWEYNLRTLAK